VDQEPQLVITTVAVAGWRRKRVDLMRSPQPKIADWQMSMQQPRLQSLGMSSLGMRSTLTLTSVLTTKIRTLQRLTGIGVAGAGLCVLFGLAGSAPLVVSGGARSGPLVFSSDAAGDGSATIDVGHLPHRLRHRVFATNWFASHRQCWRSSVETRRDLI